MIHLENLTKRYGPITAVDNVSLSVSAGEIFGFIGPNGAGKTTTIRILGGLLAPTSGSVSIGGISMAENPSAAKALVGFVPDRPFLYDKLTGMEFLEFTADLYKMPPDKFARRAPRMLELFSLSNWGDELIEAYSHGMKQRIIMASALLHEPRVLVVDEPMVGLDPRAIRLVKNLLVDLAADGCAVFLSTHTLGVAQDVCHRIGVIHRGRVIAEGTFSDLRTKADVREEDLEEVFLRLTEEETQAA
ncbi:MAG: ABC transporter ATP-binding protein [Deltaproteobacteria bacterium]|nr:ABC transporter ATP-binding protein [Deltaproteobacteria bacterium]